MEKRNGDWWTNVFQQCCDGWESSTFSSLGDLLPTFSGHGFGLIGAANAMIIVATVIPNQKHTSVRLDTGRESI